MIVINSSTRQFNIPGADMTFGVEADAGSERKYFQCPRYVGSNLDLMSCFVRLNYRNANGEVDSYLVEDMTVDGDNVLFSWDIRVRYPLSRRARRSSMSFVWMRFSSKVYQCFTASQSSMVLTGYSKG